jgi:hypothetical protein
MRYLKNFESKWYEKFVDKDELKSSAESYLAYLIDEGFQIGINLESAIKFFYEDDPGIDLHLFKESSSFEVSEVDPYGDDEPVYNYFEWIDVKEHFIPFMKMFMREYTFSNLKLYAFYGNTVRSFRLGGSLENLLNDNFEVPEELREVKICNIRKL